MNYFPMFLDIKDREVLICGGGRHALEKLERLSPFGADLHVIAEHIPENIFSEMRKFEGVIVEGRCFSEEDLDSCPVFVVAAQDRAENERIAKACRKRHIPVNAVDMQDLCDFIFPALITSGQLCVGISTGGASPAAAVELKRRIGECIPENIDEILLWMGGIREEVFEKLPDQEQRRHVLREMVIRAFALKRPLEEAELSAFLSSDSQR